MCSEQCQISKDALKTILSRYQDIKIGGNDGFLSDGVGVANVEKVMKQVGVSIKENDTTFRAFDDVLKDLAEKWNTLNSVEQASVEKVLAGTRQRNTFLVLMQNMSRAYDLSKTSAESAGLAQERYNTYVESTEAKINRLTSTMQE